MLSWYTCIDTYFLFTKWLEYSATDKKLPLSRALEVMKYQLFMKCDKYEKKIYSGM